jgi:hypothetical protein
MKSFYVVAMATNGSNIDDQQPQKISVFLSFKTEGEQLNFKKVSDIVIAEGNCDVILNTELTELFQKSANPAVSDDLTAFHDNLQLISTSSVQAISESILRNHLSFYGGDDVPTITEFLECFCTHKMFVYGSVDSNAKSFSALEEPDSSIRKEMLNLKSVYN